MYLCLREGFQAICLAVAAMPGRILLSEREINDEVEILGANIDVDECNESAVHETEKQGVKQGMKDKTRRGYRNRIAKEGDILAEGEVPAVL